MSSLQFHPCFGLCFAGKCSCIGMEKTYGERGEPVQKGRWDSVVDVRKIFFLDPQDGDRKKSILPTTCPLHKEKAGGGTGKHKSDLIKNIKMQST